MCWHHAATRRRARPARPPPCSRLTPTRSRPPGRAPPAHRARPLEDAGPEPEDIPAPATAHRTARAPNGRRAAGSKEEHRTRAKPPATTWSRTAPRRADRPPCRLPAGIRPAWGLSAPENSPPRCGEHPTVSPAPAKHTATDPRRRRTALRVPVPKPEQPPTRPRRRRARRGRCGGPHTRFRVWLAGRPSRQGQQARRAGHAPAVVNPAPAPSCAGGQGGMPTGHGRGRKIPHRNPRQLPTVLYSMRSGPCITGNVRV